MIFIDLSSETFVLPDKHTDYDDIGNINMMDDDVNLDGPPKSIKDVLARVELNLPVNPKR